MLRFVTVIAAALMVASSAPNPANIFQIDISPEEAQQYLNSPPFTAPQLSGRTAVLPLVRWNDPSFRSAEAGPTLGHYWKNGHEIENTADYVEEVYDASQFHGQDGLGGYAYGYQAPESSKIENRARSGDVTGSYTYKDGNNGLITVRYWSDSEGFHQEDDRPKVELQPVQETEEVRQARLAHEKAWQEAAAAAAQQPDPQGAYNPSNDESNYQHDYQPAASEVQNSVAEAPSNQAREGKAYPNYPQGFQAKPNQNQGQKYQAGQNQGQYQSSQAQAKYQSGLGQGQGFQAGQSQGQYQSSQAQAKYQSGQGQGQSFQASAQSSYQGQAQQKLEEPEPTGPPRGFFYSYTYPVSVLVAKNAGESGPTNPGYPVDHDTVSVNAHAQAQG